MEQFINLVVGDHPKKKKKINHFQGHFRQLTDFSHYKASMGRILFKSTAEIFIQLLLMLTVTFILGEEALLLITRVNAGKDIQI